MDDPVASGLLDRYFAGECTAAERTVLEQWIAADPTHERLVALLRGAWTEAGRTDPPAPELRVGAVHAAWRAVAKRTLEMPSGATARWAGRIPAPSQRLPWRLAAWASAVCAVVALAVWSRASRHGTPPWPAYTTAAGQRLSITLGDGTQFTLAPASRLRIAADYASGDRTVALEGEALFSVVHDAAHPFSVRTDHAVATDVGTQFDVRAYASDRAVRVAVVEGRVSVAAGRGSTDATLAAAGDVAVVDSAVAVTHGVDVAALTVWTAGRFVFREGTLADVAIDIARWYDLDVTVDSAILGRHLLGSLSAASADDALHVIAGALDVRVARDGRRVRISPRT